MNYELFIARRIAFAKGNKGLTSRPIIRIAIAGVAIGFAVMVIAVAIVSGFKKEIREKVIGFGSHIQVSNFDENNSYETRPISKEQPFLEILKKDPLIAHVQSYATKAGIVKTTSEIQGVVAKGIGPDFNWDFFISKMVEGSAFELKDSTISDCVIISKNLAGKLNLKTGDNLVMYFIQQPPRARKFRITGIYETGLEEFDELYLFCDIAQIRKLNDWNKDQVGGFEITLTDFNKLDEVGEQVYNLCGSELNARTISEIYPQIFDWLNLQNINAIIIITLMTLVSGINMISALLIIILERVKMIGSLKSLGAGNLSIRMIFFYMASLLIGRGLLIGNLVGIGLCWLQQRFGLLHLDQKSYYISSVPVNIFIPHLILLNAATLLVCMSMMILPTMAITRISPLQALRFS